MEVREEVYEVKTKLYDFECILKLNDYFILSHQQIITTPFAVQPGYFSIKRYAGNSER